MPEPLRALKLTEPPVAPVTDGYDVERIREDFPILSRTVGRWPLVYLDSANTSQKPVQVVDALEEHYRRRTTLGVNILPEDVAAAVVHFASERRSGKSTGNILNVDGGVPAAYPR